MMMSRRRGACPTLEHPMQTGDGLLARISPTHGRLSPAQLAELARAATEFGNGMLEISTRGNLQIRGLSDTSHVSLMQLVEEAGILLETGIPILAPAIFGPEHAKPRDPIGLAARIKQRLAQEQWSKSLAPKTSVIIDAGGLVDVSGVMADVRGQAQSGDTKNQWEICIGGTQQEARSAGLVGDDEAAAVAIVSALQLIAARGNKARGRDLDSDDLGSIVSAISEIQKPLEPLENVAKELIGLFALRNDRFMVSFALPFGAINATQLKVLADVATDAKVRQILLLPGKKMALVGLAECAAKTMLRKAREIGFVVEPEDPRLKIVTCVGAPACRSALLQTRKEARNVVDRFAGELTAGVRLHVSGCEKRCAAHGIIDLEMIGTARGIEVNNISTNGARYTVSDQIARGIFQGLHRQ